MFNTKIKSGDRLFEDVLYRHAHENVIGIAIDRDVHTSAIRVIFTIQNTEQTKTITDIQFIKNEDVKYYRPENIAFRANKIAKWINKIPDHIPEEQFVSWIEFNLEKP